MPVAIYEVLNNTKNVIQYYNEESGYNFVLQPNSKKYIQEGWISCSPIKYDTVPFRSSGHKINVIVQNGGPHFSVCDDSYHFYVSGMPNPGQWTAPFSNGDLFVMKVDSDSVTFIPYDDSLNNQGRDYVVVKGNLKWPARLPAVRTKSSSDNIDNHVTSKELVQTSVWNRISSILKPISTGPAPTSTFSGSVTPPSPPENCLTRKIGVDGMVW